MLVCTDWEKTAVRRASQEVGAMVSNRADQFRLQVVVVSTLYMDRSYHHIFPTRKY